MYNLYPSLTVKPLREIDFSLNVIGGIFIFMTYISLIMRREVIFVELDWLIFLNIEVCVASIGCNVLFGRLLIAVVG